MHSFDPEARDAWLRRLRGARIWIVVGAAGLSAGASAAAAASFRGHKASTTTSSTTAAKAAAPKTSARRTTSPRPAPSGPDAVPLPPSGSGNGLQPPQQAPQPAPQQQEQPVPQQQAPPVTSGGS
jgi:hypothetical protein